MNSPDSAQPPGPSSRPAAATLEFRQATKRYPGQTEPAVDALSLEVPSGEICVLVGPSGCGKTTAMRMVNRMIDITDGDILLDGRSVKERKPAELRREIGYAIQQIGLFPHLTRRRQHRHGAAPAGLVEGPHRGAGGRAARAGQPRPRRDPRPLSRPSSRAVSASASGWRARSPVDPPLMLMDEPFGAIDPINRERLQNEFLRLQREIRKTIVFVTHDIDEAIKMGDRIAIMQRGGKLAQYAPARGAADEPARPASSRTSWAPTARSSAWPSSACATSTCGRRRWCAWASRTAEARAKAAASDVPYPLLIDENGRPLGWLSERDLAGRARDGRAALEDRADPRARRRAARRALRPARRRGPVRPGGQRARARSPACCRSRSSRTRCKPDPEEVPLGSRRGRVILELAQVQIHTRTGHVRAEQRLLPALDRRQLRQTTSTRSSSTST